MQNGNGRPNRNQYHLKALDAKKIVLPWEPTIDKIVAAYLIAARQNQPLGLEKMEIEFRQDQHPTVATWLRWEDEKAYVVDVGMEKYQLTGKGSSSCSIAEREGIFRRGGVLAELAKITDKNNRTGYLKGFPSSVAWILREMYKLGYSRHEVVAKVGHVIHMWVKSQDQKTREIFASRFEDGLRTDPTIKPLLARAGGNYEDFTVSQYVRNMWLCGYPTDQIVANATYFLNAKKAAKEAKNDLDQVFQQAKRETFAENQACLIRTNESNLANWMLANKPYKLVMIREDHRDLRERHVRILTKGSANLDLRALAAALYTLEGHAQIDMDHGIWYFDVRINAMLNGTRGHRVPATYLSNAQLQKLIAVLVFGTDQLLTLAPEDFAKMLIATRPERLQGKIDRAKLVSILTNGRPRNHNDRVEPKLNQPEPVNGSPVGLTPGHMLNQ